MSGFDALPLQNASKNQNKFNFNAYIRRNSEEQYKMKLLTIDVITIQLILSLAMAKDSCQKCDHLLELVKYPK